MNVEVLKCVHKKWRERAYHWFFVINAVIQVMTFFWLVNGIHWLISGIIWLINGIVKLINGMIRLINH